MEQKKMQNLLTCIEEFATSLEQSFMQIGKRLHSFKNQIKEIKQTNVVQSKNVRYKNRIFKGATRPKKKTVKKELRLVTEEIEEDKIKEQQIRNLVNMNSFDLDEIIQTKNTVDLTGTLNQSLDFDINEWFNQEIQGGCNSNAFRQFYNIQSTRIKKSDPLANETQIKKFIQNKWDQMSQLQRSRFIYNEKKKIQPTSSKSVKKPLQHNKQEPSINRFSQFLNKKIYRPPSPPPSENTHKKQSVESAPYVENKVSASQLLNVLQKQTKNKQLKKDGKLDWIFQNFQF